MGQMKQAVDALNALNDAVRGFGQVNIPIGSCVLASTGAPLVVFADGSADGLALINSESWGYTWNPGATPVGIATNVAMPQDYDPAFDITFHAIVSKTGATVGDASSLTIAAYMVGAGALHDSDANFGGATNAIVGNAATKTTTELIRTLATANLVAPPCTLALSVTPTPATIGTDDLHLHAMWLEYTRKLAA